MYRYIAPTLLFLSLVINPSFASPKVGAPIDGVIATVDEQPITLFELGRKLNPPRPISMSQVGSDEEARLALDRLIFEKLIQLEAEKRNIHVGDEELNAYIQEVARRNGIAMADFDQALAKEGKKLDEYKREVKIEILKSKIASSYVRATSAVTEDEVKNFIKEHNITHTSNSATSPQVRLSQILLTKEKHSLDEARQIFDSIREALGKGESFEALARKYSESPEGQDGGSLGLIAEKDLHPSLFDATVGLIPGSMTGIIDAPDGYHLVRLDERVVPDTDKPEESEEEKDKALRAEVRKQLEQERVSSKMASFFESELSKLHVVEKKF